uniref:Uncharacterized protein n=2 Tax=Oryza sativa subsp. japonica TaxID=39947 RepID=Q7G5J9_ORYSJ|nr:Hypothetical protein [Oryza sativa Japonica Group]AAP51924.1 hypothetical protein LOC_Os10g03280 [Oryza sativa Japonica Group]
MSQAEMIVLGGAHAGGEPQIIKQGKEMGENPQRRGGWQRRIGVSKKLKTRKLLELDSL